MLLLLLELPLLELLLLELLVVVVQPLLSLVPLLCRFLFFGHGDGGGEGEYSCGRG